MVVNNKMYFWVPQHYETGKLKDGSVLNRIMYCLIEFANSEVALNLGEH